jgi:hypothetical protein
MYVNVDYQQNTWNLDFFIILLSSWVKMFKTCRIGSSWSFPCPEAFKFWLDKSSWLAARNLFKENPSKRIKLHFYVYACMNVCMHVRMYVCTCLWTWTCLFSIVHCSRCVCGEQRVDAISRFAILFCRLGQRLRKRASRSSWTMFKMNNSTSARRRSQQCPPHRYLRNRQRIHGRSSGSEAVLWFFL